MPAGQKDDAGDGITADLAVLTVLQPTVLLFKLLDGFWEIDGYVVINACYLKITR